jgi:hypothetical protein
LYCFFGVRMWVGIKSKLNRCRAQKEKWSGKNGFLSGPGLPDFSWHNIPKRWKNTKLSQMTIKYTNIYHSKALKNMPKCGSMVWKYTIWQPWSGRELENYIPSSLCFISKFCPRCVPTHRSVQKEVGLLH